MTAPRDALTAAIAADVEMRPIAFDSAVRRLIRDHGPALLSALDDAARVEYLESLRCPSLLEIEEDANYGLPPGKHVVLNDDNDERLGSGATVREAIDDAIRGCPSGTNGSLDLIAERARKERKP